MDFDEKGYLHPYTIIQTTVNKIKLHLVDPFPLSHTRSAIYDGYQLYIRDVRRYVNGNYWHWIDGSFATNKTNPNDIDLVNLIPFDAFRNEISKNAFTHNMLTKKDNGKCKNKYKVDGYFLPIYPPGHPRRIYSEHWMNYWKDFFSNDRSAVPQRKGILEVEHK